MHPTREKSKGPTVKLNDFARGKLGGACQFWYNKKWLGWAGGIASKTGELVPKFEIYFDEGFDSVDVVGRPGEILQDFDNDLKFINGTIYLVMGDHYFPDIFPSLYQNSWTTVIDKINNKTFQEVYYEALKDDLIGACVYKKNVYYMSDLGIPVQYGELLRNITRLHLNGSKTRIETKGIPPRIRKGFSMGCLDSTIYLAGGEYNNTPNNNIHTLDLHSMRWETHSIDNFSGSKSGCLLINKKLIINAFGEPDPSAKDRFIQIIDTGSWEIKETYRFDTEDYVLSKTYLILSCILGSLILLLAGIGLYFFFRRYQKIMAKPKFITSAIWLEPDLSPEFDLAYSCHQDHSFDCTLESKIKGFEPYS